jgi:hypothetical protein
MRTKTMLLSALLGSLGTVAVMAQSNVYSLNVVGYVNITCNPGFNIVSCPLQASPDNTLNTLLPPAGSAYKKWQVWTYDPTLSTPYGEDVALASVWGGGGLETINPGQAVWLYNPGVSTSNITFVGTVPNGPITTTLHPNSFNLVSSAIPASGDVITNSLMLFSNGVKKDQVWTYNNTLSTPYTEYVATGTSLATGWPSGDPQLPTVGGGFWYLNNQSTNNYWVQSYSVTNQ